MLQNKRSKKGSQLSHKEKSSSIISYQEDQVQDAIKLFRDLTDHSNPELEIDLQRSLSELLSNDASPGNHKSTRQRSITQKGLNGPSSHGYH